MSKKLDLIIKKTEERLKNLNFGDSVEINDLTQSDSKYVEDYFTNPDQYNKYGAKTIFVISGKTLNESFSVHINKYR